jgi:hypothetical protein
MKMNDEMRKKYEEKVVKLTKIQDKMDRLFSDLNNLYFDYQAIENMVIKDEVLIEWYKEYAKQYKKISDLFNSFDELYNKLIDMKILRSIDLKENRDDKNE